MTTQRETTPDELAQALLRNYREPVPLESEEVSVKRSAFLTFWLFVLLADALIVWAFGYWLNLWHWPF
jgi:hypothetical protein